MDCLAKLVTALGLLACGAAQAAYVSPSAPDGWRNNRAMNRAEYAAKTTLDSVTGKIIFAPNALTVPTSAGATRLPVAFPLSPSASRVAAAAVFLSPHLRAALGIASWLVTAKLIYDEVEGVWKTTETSQGDEPSTGFEYRYGDPFPWRKTQELACGDLAAYYGYTFVRLHEDGRNCVLKSWMGDGVYGLRQKRGSTCPVGTYETPSGCSTSAPAKKITEPEFVDKLAAKPMPTPVPLELPSPTYLPVDPPIVNPTTGTNPVSKSKFVPTGDPVPNPNYDPQKAPTDENQPWIQPGVKLNPSPTADDPFRIDIIPTNRPQPGPEPVTDQPDDTQPGEQPKSEETQSLCEKHPDIVACAKMDEVDPDTVKNENKTISITPKTGWGSENAACPAPKVIAVANINAEFSYQPICDLATGLRPIVIALAWLSAATMVITAARRNS